MIYKGPYKSSIALNAHRALKVQNFDCMHELIHYWFHPNGQRICIESSMTNENQGFERQANDGAARALMPEKLFARKYVELSGSIKRLSDFFFVDEKAIEYRIYSLQLRKMHIAHPCASLLNG